MLRGRYALAEDALERARLLLEGMLAPHHPSIDMIWTNRRHREYNKIPGRFELLEPLYLSLFSIYEPRSSRGTVPPLPKFILPDGEVARGTVVSLNLAAVLSNLGRLYLERGRYERARPLLARAHRIRHELLPRDHPHRTMSSIDIGDFNLAVGLYGRAEREFSQAEERSERTLDADHPLVALSVMRMAAVYLERGYHGDAEVLLARANSMLDAHDFSHHPYLAHGLYQLARIYIQQDREHDEAERLLQRASSIFVATHGPEHPNSLRALEGMALLRARQGDYERADALATRAIAAYTRVLGAEHPRTIDGLRTSAAIHRWRGEHEIATQVLERALVRCQRALGGHHPTLATVSYELARVQWEHKGYDKAIQNLERMDRIYEDCNAGTGYGKGDSMGSHAASALMRLSFPWPCSGMYYSSPIVASRRIDLAMLLWETGDLARAKQVLAMALRDQTGIVKVNTRIDRALLTLELGRRSEPTKGISADELAVRNVLSALDDEEKYIGQTLVFADDALRLEYASAVAASTDPIVSYHLQGAPNDRTLAKIAITTLLHRKGRTQDVMAQSYAALRARLPAEDQPLLEELARARTEYATLVGGGSEASSDEKIVRELERLEEQQRRIRGVLRQHSDKVASALPKANRRARRSTHYTDGRVFALENLQNVLPDDSVLVEFVQYTPRVEVPGRFHRTGGPPRYAAYLVFRDEFDWVDLGPASRIDAQVSRFRRSLATQRPDVHSVAGDVYQLVMAPVVARLEGAERMFLAPDGALNVIPFGAMHDGDRYLVEGYRLHYISTGRDLLRLLDRSELGETEVLVVTNPAGSNLPGTEHEADIIAELFPNVVMFSDQEANKTRVLDRARPRLVHMATHGFFRSGGRPSTVGDGAASDAPRTERAADPRVDNPMLHSGLELALSRSAAGAPGGGGHHLTAYEVSTWDLRGTELVVLSACDTGLGQVRAGQGVFGLRRAFLLAGAETQAMSLWKVSDESTAKVMASYYRKLASGLGRGEAMQQTQVELLRSEGTTHPYHWASFVVSGERGPLTLRTLQTLQTPPGPPPSAPRRGCRASVARSDENAGLAILGLCLLGSLRRRRRSSTHDMKA